MNHLTDEQLAAWLTGAANQDIYAHLEICPQCRAESLQLKDGISRYGLAMRQKAARAQSAHLAGNVAPRKTLALHRLSWAGAGTLAVLLVAQTAWMMKPAPSSTSFRPVAVTPVSSPAVAQMSDDELLEAVNNDLSREVPQALAPVSAITTARNEIASASTGRNSEK